MIQERGLPSLFFFSCDGTKYALTGLVSLAAFITYFIVVGVVMMATGKK